MIAWQFRDFWWSWAGDSTHDLTREEQYVDYNHNFGETADPEMYRREDTVLAKHKALYALLLLLGQGSDWTTLT